MSKLHLHRLGCSRIFFEFLADLGSVIIRQDLFQITESFSPFVDLIVSDNAKLVLKENSPTAVRAGHSWE